ncbi:MAG: C2 family cysteine protease [Thermoguttaceae bacterium]
MDPGTYCVQFDAAQRANHQSNYQELQVTVDGTNVGIITPSGSAYGSYMTGNFTVSDSGIHTISFIGLNPAGGDNTAFLDCVTVNHLVAVNHPVAATAYTPVSGSLFGPGGPSYLDVQQGYVGDCWLLASLAEVAARDPQDIQSMFTADGTTVENGSTVSLYTVRFFNSAGVAKYFTVDTELPSGGGLYDHAVNGVLWVALAEKAYAEANGANFVTTGSRGSDPYDALNNGDPSWALQAITGKSATDYAINPANIAAAWNSGELILLTTSTPASSEILGDHCYAVVNYTASSSNPFEVYNPWGINTASADGVYGLFSTNANFLSQNFTGQSFGTGAVAEVETKVHHVCETPADLVLAGWGI